MKRQGKEQETYKSSEAKKGKDLASLCCSRNTPARPKASPSQRAVQVNSDEGAIAGGQKEVKCRQGCTICPHMGLNIAHMQSSSTRHIASVQQGEGSTWPTEGSAGLHLRERWASLPLICHGAHRVFKTRRKSRILPLCSTLVTAAASTKTPCSWFCSRGDLPRGRQLARASKFVSLS